MIELLKQNKDLWDLFTRNEEYDPLKLDKHQRFSHQFSRYKDISEPKVSNFLIKNGFRFCWPNNKKFALCLTHDIDRVRLTLKNRLYTSMKLATKLKFRKSRDRFFERENPCRSFKKIIDIEKKYNATSSFYFIASDKNIGGSLYELSDFEDEINFIINNGSEVGLHGGYYSYNNFNEIKKEKEKLEKVTGKRILGYRNHYLRFKIPNTWILLSRAGFKYDSTLGYSNSVGFRNGMCFPFKPFNLHDDKEIDIIEIPLAIMDSAMFYNMRLTLDKSWQISKKIIDNVINTGGVVTILWHNDTFDDVYRKGWGQLYETILKYAHENEGWLTSGNGIYSWWSKNKFSG